VSAAVVVTGLGLVAFAAFALPGQLDGRASRHSLGERGAQLALAVVIPVAGIVAAWTADAATRLPGRRERPPTLRTPALGLTIAAVAFAGWASLYLS
jgi:hypothetical protein